MWTDISKNGHVNIYKYEDIDTVEDRGTEQLSVLGASTQSHQHSKTTPYLKKSPVCIHSAVSNVLPVQIQIVVDEHDVYDGVGGTEALIK